MNFPKAVNFRKVEFEGYFKRRRKATALKMVRIPAPLTTMAAKASICSRMFIAKSVLVVIYEAKFRAKPPRLRRVSRQKRGILRQKKRVMSGHWG